MWYEILNGFTKTNYLCFVFLCSSFDPDDPTNRINSWSNYSDTHVMDLEQNLTDLWSEQ